MNYVKSMKYEVAVAGGGVAGVAAAVEAARAGKRVLLVEKSIQLGGLATIGLVNYFVPMCNGRGVQISKGMADEFLRLSIQYGYDTVPADWKNGEPGSGNTTQRLVSCYSAPIFSLVLCKLLKDHGIDILFDTIVTDAKVKNGHISGIVLFNKSGYTFCEADMFIDATGDADILHYAGVPTVTAGNYHTYNGYYTDLERCKNAVEQQDIALLVRDIFAGSANSYGTRHPEGMPLWDGTDGDSITQYVVTNQLELFDKIKDGDRKTRDITGLPSMCQFRTTRRIDGDYTLKEEDAYRHFEDSVCAVSDCDRRDFLYEIPYRTMVRHGFGNVITVGRCVSAEGYAWTVARVIPPAILTGQAAGAAVAMAIDATCAITDVDVKALQAKLESENVMIHFDDSLIPADTTCSERMGIE
ncbi:MAG: FAD-dependent oxidoreductase [Ruminococcaceae bacterium]|nr:FAD-dependent oxidoreductase [Oscillospiraceae bacterium]